MKKSNLIPMASTTAVGTVCGSILFAFTNGCFAGDAIDGWVIRNPHDSGSESIPAAPGTEACAAITANILARIASVNAVKAAMDKAAIAPHPIRCMGQFSIYLAIGIPTPTCVISRKKYTDEMAMIIKLNAMLKSQHCDSVDIEHELSQPTKPGTALTESTPQEMHKKRTL